jgi:Domain of unknown function (DUF4430)
MQATTPLPASAETAAPPRQKMTKYIFKYSQTNSNESGNKYFRLCDYSEQRTDQIKRNAIMSVTVTIASGPSVQIPWTSGMNAQVALEQAYNTINNSQQFSYGLQYFGSFGYLVFVINETYDTFASSSAPYYYWEFLLNGQPANQGIDETFLNDGDTVGFAFSLYVAEKHAGTTLAVKHKFKTAAIRS